MLSNHDSQIRSSIALHRPKNVDTANALALLQEEEINGNRRKGYSRGDLKEPSKFVHKQSFSDKAKPLHKKDDSIRPGKSEGKDKLAALLAHRKRLGLCYKCGEKWGHNHKCPQHIP